MVKKFVIQLILDMKRENLNLIYRLEKRFFFFFFCKSMGNLSNNTCVCAQTYCELWVWCSASKTFSSHWCSNTVNKTLLYFFLQYNHVSFSFKEVTQFVTISQAFMEYNARTRVCPFSNANNTFLHNNQLLITRKKGI